MPRLRQRRVLVITGSPSPDVLHPLSEVRQTYHTSEWRGYEGRHIAGPLDRFDPRGRCVPSIDPEYLQEQAMDSFYDVSNGDYDALARGVPLADFECTHGFLPSDGTITCACWNGSRNGSGLVPLPVGTPAVQLQGAVYGDGRVDPDGRED